MKFADPNTSIRRRLFEGVKGALYWSGVASLMCARRAKGAIILMYHSITTDRTRRWIAPRNGLPEGVFEEQMRFLARRRQVVSLEDLIAAIERGTSLSPGSVVITFDDGYLDSLEIAAPILKHYSLPATLYLATGYVTNCENQWLDRLYAAFTRRTRHELALEGIDGLPTDVRQTEAAQCAYDRLAAHLLTAVWNERSRVLSALETQLGVTGQQPRLTLGWPEVSQLMRNFPDFRIGLHTRGHSDLTACDIDAAADELERCREDFARATGRRAEHFAFPYGRSDAARRELVARCGFRSAVVTAPAALAAHDTDRFALPRYEVTSSMTQFRLWTSGACPALSQMLAGRP